MEYEWASHAFQSRHRVFNLTLRPYCCGHEINLSQIKSPFITGNEFNWNDLYTAVLICAHDFKGGQSLIRKPWGVRWWGWLWRWSLKSGYIPHVALAEFTAYLSAGGWAPSTHAPQGNGSRTLTAPRAYRLITFLTNTLGLSEEEALNFPMARAHAYYAAVADKAGEIDLQGSAGEVSLLSHLANLEAREAKGEKVWDFSR